MSVLLPDFLSLQRETDCRTANIWKALECCVVVKLKVDLFGFFALFLSLDEYVSSNTDSLPVITRGINFNWKLWAMIPKNLPARHCRIWSLPRSRRVLLIPPFFFFFSFVQMRVSWGVRFVGCWGFFLFFFLRNREDRGQMPKHLPARFDLVCQLKLF